MFDEVLHCGVSLDTKVAGNLLREMDVNCGALQTGQGPQTQVRWPPTTWVEHGIGSQVTSLVITWRHHEHHTTKTSRDALTL